MPSSPPDSQLPTPAVPAISPGERNWFIGLFIILLGLRLLYARNMSFNSDEAQHLHVVWGWTVGLLQYRDIFDNHTPLFQILCAPVFRLFGETAMIMIYMRYAMILLFAASLFSVIKIGERLFSLRAGLWAAVFTGFAPFFFLKTVEFRTDDLWTAAWLGTVAIAVGGSLTVRRMFFIGLAMGITFSVSMKTTLLALAIILAALIAHVPAWRREKGWRAATILRGLGAWLCGLIAVPGIILAYFASRHALDELYYCVIQHNIVPAADSNPRLASRLFWFPATLPFFIAAATFIFRRTSDPVRAARRVVVLLTAGFFLTLLHSYWPKITSQDYPPVTPLLVVLVTPSVLGFGAFVRNHATWLPRIWLPIVLTFAEIAATLYIERPNRRTTHYLEYLDHMLRFTDRGDYVMDAKAGAIFRRRPFYFALENVTRSRLLKHLIKDDIIECLVKTRTCAASDERLLGRDLAFVRANYLPFSFKMRIAGQHLAPDPVTGRAAFDIRIAAPYTIVTPRGPAAGMLDGQANSGSIFLAPGQHEFTCADPLLPHVLVWSQAFDRGFQPNFAPASGERAIKKKRE